jgi:hypothetical protein
LIAVGVGVNAGAGRYCMGTLLFDRSKGRLMDCLSTFVFLVGCRRRRPVRSPFLCRQSSNRGLSVVCPATPQTHNPTREMSTGHPTRSFGASNKTNKNRKRRQRSIRAVCSQAEKGRALFYFFGLPSPRHGGAIVLGAGGSPCAPRPFRLLDCRRKYENSSSTGIPNAPERPVVATNVPPAAAPAAMGKDRDECGQRVRETTPAS